MPYILKIRFSAVLLVSAFCLTPIPLLAQGAPDNQFASQATVTLAATPPMGWNSWNSFGRSVTDQDVRNAADALVSTGMKYHGYKYVNLDGSWQGVRDASGVLHPNSKFPDMPALVAYVHSKGLKFGIYTTPGPTTCGGDAGSYGYEQQDANMFAQWGVDYVKYDLCSFKTKIMVVQYPADEAAQMLLMYNAYLKMGNALKATGRPMVYSLCEYGLDSVWEWGTQVGGNLWRTTGDIAPTWDSIYGILTLQEGLASYAGPGHWNDPDMLEVGNGALTTPENRSHFSMWAMLSAPLLAGNNLTQMPSAVLAVLNNPDVIALDQDPLGSPAKLIYSEGEVDVWKKDLANGDKAIAILNAGRDRVSTHPFHLSLTNLGIHAPAGSGTSWTVTAQNLWSHQQIALSDGMPILLSRHNILLVRLPADCGCF